jgi:hypothetical protein
VAQTFNIVISATDKATATVRKINNSISKITRPFEEAGKSFKSLGREIGFDKLGASLSKIGVTARDAARGVGSIVAPLGGITGIASIAGIVELADGVAKVGRNITYSAQNIGIGTTQLQEFQGAARLAGLSGEAMTQSLQSLGDTMEDALYGRNQTALMLFNRLGIGIKRTASAAVDAAGEFDALGRAIYNLSDPQKQRLVAGQFGLTAMLPLIRKYHGDMRKARAEAEKTGLIMTPAQIKSADEFADKLAKMDISVSALKNSIGNALMPAIEPLLNGLTDWIGKNRELIGQEIGTYAREFGQWLQSIDWKKVGDDLTSFIGGVDRLIRSINNVVQSIGGWKTVMIGAGAIMGAKFLSPVLSITGALAKLSVAGVSSITGLSGLAAVFGTLGVAIAGATGALIGYETYEHLLAGTKVGDAIGAIVARIAAFLGVSGAQEAVDRMNGVGVNNGAQFYDPEQLQNPNRKRDMANAMAYFMSQGWTKAQAAGIVANIDRESNFRANIFGDKGAAYGLGQWHKDRQADFEKWAGHSIIGSTLAEQLAFYDYELRHGEKRAGDMLRRAGTARAAGMVVSMYDESPANVEGEAINRGGQAEQIFNTYQAPQGPYTAGAKDNSTVHVEVALKNAPPGTTVKAKTTGNATASTRVVHSAVGAAA